MMKRIRQRFQTQMPPRHKRIISFKRSNEDLYLAKWDVIEGKMVLLISINSIDAFCVYAVV